MLVKLNKKYFNFFPIFANVECNKKIQEVLQFEVPAINDRLSSGWVSLLDVDLSVVFSAPKWLPVTMNLFTIYMKFLPLVLIK